MPTEISPDGSIVYSVFPIHCQRINDLGVMTDAGLKATVNSWTPSAQEVGSWTVMAEDANVKYSVSNLAPKVEYKLLVDGQVKDKKTANEKGIAKFEVKIIGEQICRLKKNKQK